MDQLLQRALAAKTALMPPDITVLNGKKVKNLQYCHELVKEVARGLAGALYDHAMLNNENYAAWKELCSDLPPHLHQQEWIELFWPKVLDEARATMAQMLGTGINEDLKKRIYRALILDKQIQRRGAPRKRLFRL